MTKARVRTRRVRIIKLPERITAKNGNRLFGVEAKHPKTIGWRTKTMIQKGGKALIRRPSRFMSFYGPPALAWLAFLGLLVVASVR